MCLCGMSAVLNKFRGCSNLLCHSSGILSLDVIDSSTLPLWTSVVMSVCACAESLQPCSFVTPWTVVLQAALSMGFSRQKHWSGSPCPPPGDLPDPGTEPESPTSPASAGGFFITSTTLEVRTVMDSLLSPSQAHPMDEFSLLGTRQPFCT